MGLLKAGLSLRDSRRHLRVLTLFLGVSFVAIFSTALVLSTTLSRYMIDQMMLRDAKVATDFLNSIVHVEQVSWYFESHAGAETPLEFEEFLVHVSRLPDVFRANVYGSDRRILWSSDAELVGHVFPENEELDLAMRGELRPEIGIVRRGDKDEHVGFPDGVTEFTEYYIPIRDEDDRVVGTVEVYKAPGSLLAAMRQVRDFAWIGALLAGTALFGGLALVVAYSTRVLLRQEVRIVEAERLAVVGEMASAVAHGLRNPLAAIRSCAELSLDDDRPDANRASVQEIVDQVDRLEGWIRAFLVRSRTSPSTVVDQAHVDRIIHKCLETFGSQLEKRGIRVTVARGGGNPVAQARGAELEQVLNSIISNGIEAMQDGGALEVAWRNLPDGAIEICVSDTGEGIPADMLARVFTPFASGKASGLGVGLALGRRIAERMGGSLELANRAVRGVEVKLTVPGQG